MSRKLSQRLKDRANQPGPNGQMPLQSDYFDLWSLPPDCVAIPLSNGGFALVDEEDECRVDERVWFKSYNADTKVWYAKTIIKTEHGRHHVSMHRFLFGLDRGDRIQVDHKNHDGLDNRRSTNLRLASPAQNSINTRRLQKGSSKYRGVGWNPGAKKWQARITQFRSGRRRVFHLGMFDVEAEAAFAFQMAAPLLKDPEFLVLEEIPKDELPDARRQDEIKRDAIAKLKAAIAGIKTRLKATSQYNGVSYVVPNRNWAALLGFAGKPNVRVGFYDTEKEAAYAHDCAVQILKLTKRKMNKIERDELGDPGRADEIRKEVALRLEALRTGQKVGLKSSSRYRGVSRSKNYERWIATITTNNNNFYLGSYKSEIDAAVAFNLAIPILDAPRLVPNHIPNEDMPSPEAMDLIRRNVASKLMVIK